jgi:hypothetical protein
MLLLMELFPAKYVSRSLNSIFLVIWLFVAVAELERTQERGLLWLRAHVSARQFRS